MRVAIEDVLAALKEHEAKEYDGIVGTLPPWMPQPLVNEFTAIRTGLLGGYCHQCESTHTADEVSNWLAAYRTAMRPVTGYRSVPHFPIEHEYDLRDLAYIQDIAKLGADRGLAAYLGTGADKVHRTRVLSQEQRQRAQRPRTDGLQRAILRLLKEKPAGEGSLPYITRRLEEMHNAEIDGVCIEGVDEGHIQWHDNKTKTGETPISGLKDRVSRASNQLLEKT